MAAPETITREELTAFCVRHKDYGVPTADAIWDDIVAHREPGYEPGCAYVDARGDNYLRSETGGWVDYSATWHPHAFPKRPLRKLVPEGSRPDHAAVLAEIVAWTSESNQYRVLADRICKLIGVSDDR